MSIRSFARHIREIDLLFPGWVEAAMLRSEPDKDSIDLPLIAIVGPPRVGSTLMYQLLVSQFRAIWFDNFQHTFLRYPYLSFWISQRFIHKNTGGFRSEHGFIGGIGGLSEGNFFWPYWFDMDLEQKLKPAPAPNRIGHVRTVLNRMYEDTGLPMLNSFNTHAFYLTELRRHFNKVVVINMRRDPVANAVSLLRGRKTYRKNINDWWSIRPAACYWDEPIDCYQQIYCQVVEIYRTVQEQRRQSVPPIIDVHYEQLCASPQEVLDDVYVFCQDEGIALEKVESPPPVPDLQIRGPRPGEIEDASRFSALFDAADLENLWS